jgi:ankyrin repeat protein
MAVHRGRLDLLESLVYRDRSLLYRQFQHEAFYPPEAGCSSDHSLALHGTPLAGGTLLHLCADNNEVELARWLLDQGADANAPAAIDADGFGGHTALYGCVVSQPYRNGVEDTSFARLLLERGARTDVRANLRKRLRFVDDETMHEYRDVTPLEWGRAFHDQAWVNPAVLELLT